MKTRASADSRSVEVACQGDGYLDTVHGSNQQNTEVAFDGMRDKRVLIELLGCE